MSDGFHGWQSTKACRKSNSVTIPTAAPVHKIGNELKQAFSKLRRFTLIRRID
jgi:hypothetical protein